MLNKIIKLNRGDSFEFKLAIPDKEDPSINYILDKQDEVLYFALLEPHKPFEEALIMQGYTFDDQNTETGELIVKLSPNDTRRLAPGVYYYTVKLRKGGSLDFINNYDEPDEVRTIIERTKFIINE